MPESEAYRKGVEMRRKLLGDAYVERANKQNYNDPVTRKFIDTVTETVFGTLWTRPGLDLKTRALVCVVSLPPCPLVHGPTARALTTTLWPT